MGKVVKQRLSIRLNMRLLDELPPQASKERMPNKYELNLNKFVLSRKPAAIIKADSMKQASTITVSFRRAIKNTDNDYPVRVEKHGDEIYLINTNMEG